MIKMNDINGTILFTEGVVEFAGDIHEKNNGTYELEFTIIYEGGQVGQNSLFYNKKDLIYHDIARFPVYKGED